MTAPSLREAAQMALDALAIVSGASICEASHHKKADRHYAHEACPLRDRSDAAIVALRSALALPDAEPVACASGAEVRFGTQEQRMKLLVASLPTVGRPLLSMSMFSSRADYDEAIKGAA